MPFSSADCAMVFCVERADVARIANTSAFLNMALSLSLPLILGKSQSPVVLVFLIRVRGGIHCIWVGFRQCDEIVTFVKLLPRHVTAEIPASHET